MSGWPAYCIKAVRTAPADGMLASHDATISIMRRTDPSLVSLNATFPAGALSLPSADSWVQTLDHALRTLFAPPAAQRPMPQAPQTPETLGVSGQMQEEGALTEQERLHAGALMRINHVGEVCAQALYMGQAFTTQNEALREEFIKAAQEEADHLAWTAERLKALRAEPSKLNPLWYAGSFVLGALASRLGDHVSLGFMAETEQQVEAHLASHLQSAEQGGLPEADLASRAVLAQMRADEAEHGQSAKEMGAIDLPEPVKQAMKGMAKLMTRTAYYI